MALSVDTRQTLDRHLRDLRLPTMRTSYEALARQAEKETLSYERYLLELTQRPGDVFLRQRPCSGQVLAKD